MKAAGNDTRIIRSEDGTPWGVFLAGAGSAEHEAGIHSILMQMHIDPEGKMIEGRSMTAPFTFAEAKGQVTRTYYLEGQKRTKKVSKVSYLAMRKDSIEDTKRRIYNLDRYSLETEITAAWDEREFKLAAWEKEAAEFLEELKEAAARGDLSIWTGNTPSNNRNPFSYVGLIIAITSKMPEAAKEAVNKSDAEDLRIKTAAKKTGILDRIEKKRDSLSSWRGGPAYYALSPRWTESLKNIGREGETIELKTKHPVVFFLNPARQKDFNHGWFTVEELEQWIKGKGPVIKKAA